MLLQVLVLNNVYLGGYINPCLYLLFVAMLPTNTGKIPTLLIAFATGLCNDIFTNMLGFHTFACTFMGFVQVVSANKIILRDSEEVIETPSINSVSYQQMGLYLALLFGLFYVVYYLMLSFSFHDFFPAMASALLSTIVTWLLAMLYQALFFRASRKTNK